MYRCPDCGGNLIYDIPSHTLLCKYCNTYTNPYSLEQETDGVELDTYETTIFTCPQCGGEILSTDGAMAGFCSYCGASTILSSRLVNEKRPQILVPFEITKEHCKELYNKKMKHAFFAPKALKSKESIESFRGIYMPYWKYKIVQKGNVSLDGKKTHRSGDYLITDHYNIGILMDNEYDGFTYDSSSSFYDNISEEVAPFNVKEAREFTPSLLSGFYADISDVPSDIYKEDAEEEAIDTTYRKIKKLDTLKEMEIDKDKSKKELKSRFSENDNEIQGVMMPVWFMSYRKKDRVAYATVNGQTGKIVADIPIDGKKYTFFSLLLAVPIFLLLNLFFTFKPDMLIKITLLIASAVSVIYVAEMKAIKKKEYNEGDKGISWDKNKSISKAKENNSKVIIEFASAALFGKIVSVAVMIIVGFFTLSSIFDLSFNFLWCISVGVTIVCAIIGQKIFNAANSIKGKLGLYSTGLATIIGSLVIISNTFIDEIYYIATIISIVAIFITTIDIIRNYNVLSTRQLPQFNKQGGDDRAQ